MLEAAKYINTNSFYLRTCRSVTMSNPLVSILINNYNYGRFLDDAIQSALSQTYKNIEIIVVDDGSTDNSREVLENFQGKITSIFKSNGGQASAFNVGVAHSKGEIISFLDADDAFAPNKIERIMEEFNRNSDILWCFDKIVHCNEKMQPLSTSKRSDKFYYSDHRNQIVNGSLGKHLVMEIPATSGLSFKAELLSKIFPMPESESCSMCENYMKYIAVGLGTGTFLDTALTMQRIHGKNLFTRNDRDSSMTARISILTGYWLNKNFPQLAKFSDTQIALGLSEAKNIRSLGKTYTQAVKEHLRSRGFFFAMLIHIRSAYYLAKKKFASKSPVSFN
jgi:glycosyltransferase involved in cell wall biosynthesis